MSGICGIAFCDGSIVDAELLRGMTSFLSFRGPDAQDVWMERQVGFGHALLKTTFESETECQPLSLDGRVWITADARIDGRRELRRELEASGRSGVANASDAELILHAYHAWVEDCPKHLLGDFSFAIWDGPRQRLFCARDHFGVKPFFYACVQGGLVFSNTLDCVRKHPSVSSALDDLWIADFLSLEIGLDPTATAFAGVRRLAPANTLTWTAGSIESRCYWRLPAESTIQQRPAGDYVERFKELLDEAVSDRLRTDRVGVDMSGGLDSSSVATVARSVLPAQSKRAELRAYTVVYDHMFADEERDFATMVAQRLDIPISYCVADSYGLFEGGLTGPEPVNDPHAAIGAATIRAASEHCRVVLTGWDGDALLNESPKPYFRLLYQQRKLHRFALGMLAYAFSERRIVPLGFRDWIARRAGKGPQRSLAYPAWLNPELEQRLDLPARWAGYNSAPGFIHPVRPGAFRSLSNLQELSSFFDFYDPGVSRRPVEYRHPLLDLRLVEFCLSLPPWPWCVRKRVLREAMKGLLPEPVRMRPKSPLAGFPYLSLLRQEQTRWVDQFVAFPSLNRYVVREKVPPVWGARDPDATWINMRPLSLNIWLRGMQPTDH